MGIFSQIVEFIKELFDKIPAYIKEYSGAALEITNKLKEYLDGDFADLLVALVPGDWDDALRAQALLLLESIAKVLGALGTIDIPEAEKVAVQNALLAKAHSGLIALQDGNRLAESKYDLYAQALYSNVKVDA
ncbi:MAG: hypothetical protein QM642_07580 [Edaphocola sp.]